MTDPTPTEDGFCPLCGVTLDLHDGPDSCAEAEAKASMLERFERMFR